MKNKNYTSEDGLHILHYLGINNITDREREKFKEKWDIIYKGSHNVIHTIWTLYAQVLPFTCGASSTNSFDVAQGRDSDFGERLEKTGLDEKLRTGKSLGDILKERVRY